MTEFKPGDIAALVVGGEECRGVMVRTEKLGDTWHVSGHSFFKSLDVNNAHYITDARPLVVIDPEDREQIKRLLRAFWCHGTDDCDDPQAMADGLRSMLEPPKPPEPTGLGAVVEDANGILWVRVTANGVSDAWKPNHSRTSRLEWDSVPAVKVRYSGVTP